MGEIAEMMLEGIMCEGCGEYLGDGAGHPQRCIGCGGSAGLDDHMFFVPKRDSGFRRSEPFECHCHRLFSSQVAMEQHQRDRHPGAGEAKKKFVCGCGSVFRTSAAMAQHMRDKHEAKP